MELELRTTNSRSFKDLVEIEGLVLNLVKMGTEADKKRKQRDCSLEQRDTIWGVGREKVLERESEDAAAENSIVLERERVLLRVLSR